MIFTLNGELLITNKGSELAFTDYEIENGKSTYRLPPFQLQSRRKIQGELGEFVYFLI